MKVSLDELRNLPQQRLRINFKEDLVGLEAVKPVLGELLLIGGASGARLSGEIQTILKLTCHSCLKFYFQALNFQIDERFIYEDYLSPAPKEELLKEDFVETIPYSGAIDISDVVYQAVTLATPTYCSCGPSCPGPPWDNENQMSFDPRWQNLKTLLRNEDS